LVLHDDPLPPRLFQIGAHNINQLFAGLGGGAAELWFKNIRAYVVFNHFGHEGIQCASCSGDEQEKAGTAVSVPNLAFYRFDLAKDTPDAFD
jgi:hypothetical protein